MPVKRVPLDPQRVLLRIEATDKAELLERMYAAVMTAEALPAELSVDELRETVESREAERSTVVAEGIAVPHTRVPGLDGVRICVATLKTPLRWEPEAPLVWLVVLIVAPRENPALALKIMGQLAELLRDPATRTYLKMAEQAKEVARWLDRRLKEDDAPLTARDIMRPSLGLIKPHMRVPEMVRRMVAYNLDAAGVTDEYMRLVGMVTADKLFTLGMPDFFAQLKSVSFIPEFDPFERYFQAETKLTAGDVMSTEYAAVTPEATVLEVVFLLAVKRFPKVFVVDDEHRLIGVIDRIRVIDRILNL